ncbi:MAG TPA: glycosyltransferase [Bacteroidales bacterium]|jgi:glycosyltransferase involved in cell wall biosynthesis|nr:glycosyltransferase [Bacteroidales bacterium]
MKLPKVLIFGQAFNNKYGGGITLSNLFKGWSEDRIAVAATGHIMYSITTDICRDYYQLGENEFKWKFPFNLIQRQYKSGPMIFNTEQEGGNKNRKKNILRHIIVNQVFYPILKQAGLFHGLTRIRMSSEFQAWLSRFKPEILYLQVTTRDSIVFASELIDHLKIPSVIHIMDDWPSTISNEGLFKKYWTRKIDKEFKLLLTKINLYFSISNSMSVEYLKRYNKQFKAFHNPIDTSKYKISKNVFKPLGHKVRILYTGRIGVANKNTIKHFANFISKNPLNRRIIEFDIYTSNVDSPLAKKLNRLNSVKVIPAVKYDEVPDLFSRYDILLLPLDFTSQGQKYAQFSIPTKASEYMASGIPILVYAPGQTAISQFVSKYNCGHCVTELDFLKLEEALELMINDVEYRSVLSRNAIETAFDLFDSRKVRKEFELQLINLSNFVFEKNNQVI